MHKPRAKKSIKLSLSKKQSTITAFFEKPKIKEQDDNVEVCTASVPEDTDKSSGQKRKSPEDSPEEIIPVTPERVKPKLKKHFVKKLKQNFENVATDFNVAESLRNRETEPKKLLVENKGCNVMSKDVKNKTIEKQCVVDLDSEYLDVKNGNIKLPHSERLSDKSKCEKGLKIENQKTETLFSAAQKLEDVVLKCVNNKCDAVGIFVDKENKLAEHTRCLNVDRTNGNCTSAVRSTEDEVDLQVVINNSNICDKSTIGLSESLACLNTEVTERKEVTSGNNENEVFTSNSDSLLFDDWESDHLKGWELGHLEQNAESQLQLDTLQRCEVAEVSIADGRSKLLTLKCGDLNTTCLLKDFWADSVVQVGDVVTAQARKASQESPSQWVIDNTHGFLVQQPDMLVSSTSVVGSLFCARRGVLQEWFRGLDSDSSILVIGSLVHLLFQEVLKRKLATEAEVIGVVKELLARPSSVCMLYGANMTLETGLKELMVFVPHIAQFIATYVQRCRPPSSGSWQGSLCGIQDIEDNIWVPGFGIKGKVDVSVEVKIHNRTKMMPLELKTGRASFSAEHKGQVMLYTMMMSELGEDVSSGLLLYLRGCLMQEVQTSHKEKRDLILLRNNLAHHLKQVPELESGVFHPPSLPGPISHHNACTKCPYLTLCSSYLSRDGLSQLSNEHPLKGLSSEATSHLKPTHIDYLIHWGGLMTLETAEDSLQHKDLWCKTPADREKQGRCICNLVIKGEVKTADEGMFIHVLQKENRGVSDLHYNIFTKGDYIVVSTDVRPAVTTGTVLDVTDNDLQLLLNKNLKKGSTSKLRHFHVDFGSYSGGKVFNLTNLGHLLEDTPITERLRRLIIDKEAPSFQDKLPSNVLQVGRKILRPLNVAQRRAVIKALTANDYLLIKGMPGTGKTQTIVAMVELVVKLGNTVLITSHTHSAVDNVLLKLVARGVEFLRLGSTTRIHPDLRSWGEAALTADCSDPTQLAKLYTSRAVVATTCLGAGHPLLTKRIFDMCIVDESTQVLQVSVLRSLFSASRFVLIGDPNQLPPVVRNKTARELGMSESLFARLDGAGTVCLDLQYRMNQTITDLANKFTYEGQLKCGNSEVANSVLNLPHLEHLEKDLCEQQWLQNITSSDLTHSALFLDTGCQTDTVNNLTNVHEAALIFHVVHTFLKGGVLEKDIGVIAPYRAQVALLAKMLNVEVNTVDQYQGRDKSIIIFSCTRSGQGSSNKDKETEILSDYQRLTVAITRAKHKLLLVGDHMALSKYNTFQKLFSCLAEEQTVHLSDGSNGFFWKNLMDPIKDYLTE